MLEISLCYPMSVEVGSNVLTVTAKDLSFATTAIVKTDQITTGELVITNISYSNTLGAIPNEKRLNEEIANYLKNNSSKLVS